MPALIVCFALMAGSLASSIMIEMLFNDGWLFAFKVLGVIELLVVPWLLYRFREPLLDQSYFRPWGILFLLMSACAGFLLFGAPYIFLANVATSSGNTILFSGPVASKWIDQGKAKSYILQVIDRRTKISVDILVNRQEYESAPIGGQFSRCMSVGGFGLPYRWRYGTKPSCAVH